MSQPEAHDEHPPALEQIKLEEKLDEDLRLAVELSMQQMAPEPESEPKPNQGGVFIDAEFADPDEMDFSEEESVEDEDINDNQQRLHDMLGSSSDSSEGE